MSDFYCPHRLVLEKAYEPVEWGVFHEENDYVKAVKGFEVEDFHIFSKGKNSTQWYEFKDPPPEVRDTKINHVLITACVKNSDPAAAGAVRIDLGVGDVTVGGNTYPGRCDYVCITEKFEYDPSVEPPAKFTWEAVDKLKAGVTSINNNKIQVNRLWVDVICGDLYKPCPHCCCCCLCFNPRIRFFNIHVHPDYPEPPGKHPGDLKHPLTIPYAGKIPGLETDCWFFRGVDTEPPFHLEPIEYGSKVYPDGTTITMNIIGLAMTATPTQPDGTPCNAVSITIMAKRDHPVHGVDYVSFPVFANMELKCCEPYHLSVSGPLEVLGQGAIPGKIIIDCYSEAKHKAEIDENCEPIL